MKIKFFWNGIKIDGILYRCHYSDGELINHPAGTLTIYRKEYGVMPVIAGLTTKNDSDSMTDYFETDRIIVEPDNPFHADVLTAIAAYNEHYSAKREKTRLREEAVKARLHPKKENTQ